MWGLAGGSPCFQIPNCNSLLIPNKSIFAGGISDSLFVSVDNIKQLFTAMNNKQHKCVIAKTGGKTSPHITLGFWLEALSRLSARKHDLSRVCLTQQRNECVEKPTWREFIRQSHQKGKQYFKKNPKITPEETLESLAGY